MQQVEDDSHRAGEEGEPVVEDSHRAGEGGKPVEEDIKAVGEGKPEEGLSSVHPD